MISCNLPIGAFKGLIKITKIVVCSTASTFLEIIKVITKVVITFFIVTTVVSMLFSPCKLGIRGYARDRVSGIKRPGNPGRPIVPDARCANRGQAYQSYPA
jgi:hypothetical protein